MAKHRYVNTHFWDDKYIMKLPPLYKLIFLYLITNPLANAAGVYEITIERMSFDTGVELKRVREALERFQADKKVVYFPASSHILLVNSLKNQPLNQNMKAGIESIMANFPEDVKAFYEKTLGKALEGFQSLLNASGILSYSILFNSTLSNPVQEVEQGDGSFSENDFEDFWKIYPRKIEKKKAQAIWKQIKPSDEQKSKICSAVEAQIKWRVTANGEFRPEWPHPTTWLRGERWNDELHSGNGGRASPAIQAAPLIKKCGVCGREYDRRKISTCPTCAGIA